MRGLLEKSIYNEFCQEIIRQKEYTDQKILESVGSYTLMYVHEHIQ